MPGSLECVTEPQSPPLKNCEGSGILPYLQDGKLTCYCFSDPGRTPKTPKSETKDYIIPGKSSSPCFIVACIYSCLPSSIQAAQDT